jgi:hypothetical protein
VNKIGSSRFFDLPKMLKEVLSRLSPQEPKYKVYTALLTQSGGDVPNVVFGDESLVPGVSYTITKNPDNYDLTPYGAPNSNVGTSFVSTSDMAFPPSYTESLELSYNTGAPVATVLENTLGGDIVWSRVREGMYIGTLLGVFTTEKTFILGLTTSYSQTSVLRDNYSATYGDENSIYVVSMNDNIDSDNVLISTPIEIRVYN